VPDPFVSLVVTDTIGLKVKKLTRPIAKPSQPQKQKANAGKESSAPCSCAKGRSLVYVADRTNFPGEIDKFESEARQLIRGDDGTNHTIRSVSDFRPNELLADDECVESLIVAAHGAVEGNGSQACMDIRDGDLSNGR